MDIVLLIPIKKLVRVFVSMMLQSRDSLLLEDDSSKLLSEN